MERRRFVKLLLLGVVLPTSTARASLQHLKAIPKKTLHSGPGRSGRGPGLPGDENIRDYLSRIRNPDTWHKADIILEQSEIILLEQVVARLQRLCSYIGYGNFGVLGFDDAISYGAAYSGVGAFPRQELDFLEELFYRDGAEYGFFGEKQIRGLTATIDCRNCRKIPGTGNYLFRGESQSKFSAITEELGDEVVLTSGIRGLVKQFYLFLSKAGRHGGNLSLASRSLAPPGYSYHATGDFDIGQRGFGASNFTERFVNTPVFKKLAERGIVQYRYNRDNMLGVRYEPWHVKL